MTGLGFYAQYPTLVRWGVFLIGVLVGMHVRKNQATALPRAPFFAHVSSAIAAWGIVILTTTNFAIERIASIGALAFLELLAMAIIGIWIGKTAAGRALHAYATTDKAVYAAIPFLNLVLMGKRGRPDIPARARTPRMTGLTVSYAVGMLFMGVACLQFARVAVQRAFGF